MTLKLTSLLALVAIILGLVGEIIDEKILMATLEWFVLAIALSLLEFDFSFGSRSTT